MLGYKGLADFLCMITTGDKAGWTRERARPGKRVACFGVFLFLFGTHETGGCLSFGFIFGSGPFLDEEG